jgi:hypothetical protein
MANIQALQNDTLTLNEWKKARQIERDRMDLEIKKKKEEKQ